MKSVRLLPVVVLAGLALLLFKSVGLLTDGGYVLTGVAEVMAEVGAKATEEGGAEAAEERGDTTITLPSEPTMMDASPTLDDGAPTLGESGEDYGAPAAGDAAAETEYGDPAAGVAEEHAAETAPVAPDLAAGCDPAPADATAEPAHGAVAEGTAVAAELPSADCAEPGDAIPVTYDADGNKVPLVGEDGGSLTEKQILERLGERRVELDAYEAELAIRAALVEAAEKRIEERVVALQAIEARINAMVDQKKAMDEGEFKGLVSLYEAMKPGDAAQIFDKLDMGVLLRVARAMNPKKLAPVMAKMDPEVAQTLTVNLAMNEAEPTIDFSGEDLSALPQIVGQ